MSKSKCHLMSKCHLKSKCHLMSKTNGEEKHINWGYLKASDSNSGFSMSTFEGMKERKPVRCLKNFTVMTRNSNSKDDNGGDEPEIPHLIRINKSSPWNRLLHQKSAPDHQEKMTKVLAMEKWIIAFNKSNLSGRRVVVSISSTSDKSCLWKPGLIIL